jgi:manganese transport protein
VVLSFGLPFVLVPLIRLTSNRELLGADANGRAVQLAGWTIITAIVALNAVLVAGIFR